jgi:probable F420-dependent oxidoreductase
MTTKIAIGIFPNEYSIPPHELAREIEVRGFDALFVAEHTHFPTSRKIQYRLGNHVLPDHYVHLFEPYVALAAAAAVTKKIKLGTAISLIAQRDAIQTAKAVASLDVISEGRIVLGVGAGWNIDEMQNHGIDPEKRWEVLDEKLQLMRSLWRDEVASFDGQYIKLTPSWAWPKTVQQPAPPILLGAQASKLSFAHVVRYCNGWMPIGDQAGFGGNFDLARNLERLRNTAAEAGRDPKSISITLTCATLSPERIEQYSKLGIERAISYVPSATREVTLPVLDKWATLNS